eukprot:261296-Prymnesium_polylepis.1
MSTQQQAYIIVIDTTRPFAFRYSHEVACAMIVLCGLDPPCRVRSFAVRRVVARRSIGIAATKTARR